VAIKRHAVAEQGFQEVGEQHGVGDVADMEFVQAQHALTRGPALGDELERIGLALEIAAVRRGCGA
jgi:hypothetical protein